MCLPPCTWLCHPAHGCVGDAYRPFYALILGVLSSGREGGSMSGWESEWECRWRVVGWEGGVRRVRVGGKCWGVACFADHPDHLSNVHMSVSPIPPVLNTLPSHCPCLASPSPLPRWHLISPGADPVHGDQDHDYNPTSSQHCQCVRIHLQG